MFFRNRFIIFLIYLNIFHCLIVLNEKSDNSKTVKGKKIETFEELDQIMSNSEFSEAWKNFRYKMIPGASKINYEQKLKTNKKKKLNLQSEVNEDTGSCLLSKEDTKKIISKNFGQEIDEPSDELRFIFGKCNPIILVPGMLSTKLEIKINCDGLYNNEIDIFKKMRFYCGNYVCSDVKNKYEEQELFITIGGAFQIVYTQDTNKYSACLGYFLTFFNSKKACSPYEDNGNNDEYVCNYSENIEIGYYGSFTNTKSEGKCGLNAIQNVIMPPGIEQFADIGIAKSYAPLIERLENKGYKPGFSLAGIPNDYRHFLANNKFTTDAIKYQVETLYKNTGKKVVLIGHSFGTITVLNNLIHYKNDKDLLNKIKKFIAVGPPFAGSTELINVYFNSANKYQKEFNVYGSTLHAGIDEFGFGFITNSIPTVYELRPLPIIGNLFNKPGYEIFAEAIKERFFLEKKCGHSFCDDYIINKYSHKFNALFKDYFPLLTDSDCKFDSNLKEENDVFNRKCLLEMRNMFDCPMVIEESRDENGKLPNDFDIYCGKKTSNIFYQKSCDNSNKQCLDPIYSKHPNYRYDESNPKLQWFKEKWEKNGFSSQYGEVNSDFYLEKEKYTKTPQKQIEFYEKNSKTKDMPIPTVDTDIVYSTYLPTVASFIFDKNDWHHNFNILYKGGDGVVPNWSPIIPGLKWIYDAKKYNKDVKIRLVEFCSRLGKNSKYSFDSSKDQKFAAISCECLNDKNEYDLTKDCGHGVMISDAAFFNYVDSIIYEKNINEEISSDQTKAFNNYDGSINYEDQCNDEFVNILGNSMDKNNSSN